VLNESVKDALPPAGDKVLYVFYDFETTQNTRYTTEAKLNVNNVVCVQQFCSRCEDGEDVVDCVRCGRRKHSHWEVPVRDLLTYLTEPRPWANTIIAIAQNVKAFILDRAILLELNPEIIMNSLKIMCMKLEHRVFLDSVSFLPCPLRKLSEAFGMTASKSWYPYYFNTEENLDYVGPMLDASFYGVNEMGEKETSEFLAVYAIQKSELSDNRRGLESYCQDDVTVRRQAFRAFRSEFMQIGNI